MTHFQWETHYVFKYLFILIIYVGINFPHITPFIGGHFVFGHGVSG